MGLAERRSVENFKTNSFEKYSSEIKSMLADTATIEVDWDSLPEDGYVTDLFATTFPKIYFEPIINALKEITVDDFGKKAAKAGIKRIVVKNTGEYHAPNGFSFTGGVLTIDHRPAANVDDFELRAEKIKSLLEEGL